MTDEEIDTFLDSLVEKLAAIEHERWAHWQCYLHQQARRLPDGSLVLPHELVARWERQLTADYAELSEREKESDRQQVRRYLPVLSAAFKSLMRSRARRAGLSDPDDVLGGGRL